MPQTAMLHSSFLEKAFYKVKGLMNTITSIWGFFFNPRWSWYSGHLLELLVQLTEGDLGVFSLQNYLLIFQPSSCLVIPDGKGKLWRKEKSQQRTHSGSPPPYWGLPWLLQLSSWQPPGSEKHIHPCHCGEAHCTSDAPLTPQPSVCSPFGPWSPLSQYGCSQWQQR